MVVNFIFTISARWVGQDWPANNYMIIAIDSNMDKFDIKQLVVNVCLCY